MEIIYRHFESLTSTNDWAKSHIDTFNQQALTVITANTQTHGRGRFGRNWISPADENLYVTFAFFKSNLDPIEMTHLLALTTAQLLQEKGVIAKIKWPNDLLVKQKKIAGILCETAGDQGIVVGMGLNVNMTERSLALIDQPATSLLCETGILHELQPLLRTLAEHFAKNLETYFEYGFAPFSSAFQQHL